MCAGTDDEGGGVMGSTYDTGTDMPAGSFKEGTVFLSRPNYIDGTEPACTGPGFVRIYPTIQQGMDTIAIPVPADALAVMNG